MWIDTHCHLDAGEFGEEADAIATRAGQQGVRWIVIPAVAPDNFRTVAGLAQRHANCVYALGIHPLYVERATESDLDVLRGAARAALDDPRFVAIGEIGLDFFVPGLNKNPLREKQEHFYSEQLKLARELDLPVLLHVRKSQDIILKYLRRIKVRGGIAHAFNGSAQQAAAFVELGFKLGFGGAMTFTRALQIRRLAAQCAPESLVLETDAPDISPVWLHPEPNSPEQLPRIGETLAGLRSIPLEAAAQLTTRNALDVMPRLARLV